MISVSITASIDMVIVMIIRIRMRGYTSIESIGILVTIIVTILVTGVCCHA